MRNASGYQCVQVLVTLYTGLTLPEYARDALAAATAAGVRRAASERGYMGDWDGYLCESFQGMALALRNDSVLAPRAQSMPSTLFDHVRASALCQLLGCT
jgi:hypothetical protein